MCQAKRQSVRAFTLVEMLVVVSVILLLLTMVLPTLDRSFEVANRARCATNLRSGAQAAHAYEGDHEIPPPNWTSGTQGEAPCNYNEYEKKDGWLSESQWVQARNPMYPDYLKTLKIMVCPSNSNVKLEKDERRPEYGYYRRIDNGQLGRIYYFYEWNHELSKLQGYSKGGYASAYQETKNKPNEEEIHEWRILWRTRYIPATPAKTYMYYEADDGVSGGSSGWTGSNHPRILIGTQGNDDAGGNVAFADASVRWITSADKIALQAEWALSPIKGRYGIYKSKHGEGSGEQDDAADHHRRE